MGLWSFYLTVFSLIVYTAIKWTFLDLIQKIFVGFWWWYVTGCFTTPWPDCCKLSPWYRVLDGDFSDVVAAVINYVWWPSIHSQTVSAGGRYIQYKVNGVLILQFRSRSDFFNVFFFVGSLLYLPRLHLFDPKYYKNSNIITIYNNCFLFEYNSKCNLFLWCKAEFSEAIAPVFSVTWSFRNHSNMLICC